MEKSHCHLDHVFSCILYHRTASLHFSGSESILLVFHVWAAGNRFSGLGYGIPSVRLLTVSVRTMQLAFGRYYTVGKFEAMVTLARSKLLQYR